MAQQTEIEISRREVMGKATKRLRKQGIIPANIFGHQEASQAVQIDAVTFERLRRSHGMTGIIGLRLPGSSGVQTAVIRHVQHDPRSGKIIHVDFFRVSMDERLHFKIPLRFVGEAPAVKNDGGVLLHLLDALEVECQAKNIPESIEVDLAPLTEVDAMLHAEDVKLPANVTLATDPKEGVVKVAAPRFEKEEVPAAATEEAVAAGPAETAGQEKAGEVS